MNRKETAVDYAISLLHHPYRWGGDDPISGFDCSGLVQEILASVGADPTGDQTAHDLWQRWKHLKSKPVEGALVFFGSADRVTHVGFCIDELHMVEAGGGGRSTLTTQDAARQNAFVRIRPIARRPDLVGCVMPPY